MKTQIKITKEIYQRSMMCGVQTQSHLMLPISKNCAIALAVREIDKRASVGATRIKWYGIIEESVLPERAQLMIHVFDTLVHTPEQRPKLEEFTFEIELPDALIEKIGIEEAYDAISNSSTLEFAE